MWEVDLINVYLQWILDLSCRVQNLPRIQAHHLFAFFFSHNIMCSLIEILLIFMIALLSVHHPALAVLALVAAPVQGQAAAEVVAAVVVDQVIVGPVAVVVDQVAAVVVRISNYFLGNKYAVFDLFTHLSRPISFLKKDLIIYYPIS